MLSGLHGAYLFKKLRDALVPMSASILESGPNRSSCQPSSVVSFSSSDYNAIISSILFLQDGLLAILNFYPFGCCGLDGLLPFVVFGYYSLLYSPLLLSC